MNARVIVIVAVSGALLVAAGCGGGGDLSSEPTSVVTVPGGEATEGPPDAAIECSGDSTVCQLKEDGLLPAAWPEDLPMQGDSIPLTPADAAVSEDGTMLVAFATTESSYEEVAGLFTFFLEGDGWTFLNDPYAEQEGAGSDGGPLTVMEIENETWVGTIVVGSDPAVANARYLPSGGDVAFSISLSPKGA